MKYDTITLFIEADDSINISEIRKGITKSLQFIDFKGKVKITVSKDD